MRIARVLGTVTLSRRLPELRAGRLLIAEALDAHALTHHTAPTKRANPMPDSLVVYDQHGAGVGQLIAVSEGGEATQPFRPDRVPVDAYCAAIIDTIDLHESSKAAKQ